MSQRIRTSSYSSSGKNIVQPRHVTVRKRTRIEVFVVIRSVKEYTDMHVGTAFWYRAGGAAEGIYGRLPLLSYPLLL